MEFPRTTIQADTPRTTSREFPRTTVDALRKKLRQRLTGDQHTDCFLKDEDVRELAAETGLTGVQINYYTCNFRHRTPMEKRAKALEDRDDVEVSVSVTCANLKSSPLTPSPTQEDDYKVRVRHLHSHLMGVTGEGFISALGTLGKGIKVHSAYSEQRRVVELILSSSQKKYKGVWKRLLRASGAHHVQINTFTGNRSKGLLAARTRVESMPLIQKDFVALPVLDTGDI